MLAVKDDHFGKYRLNIKKTKVGIVLDASCNGWINVFENFLNSNNRRIHWVVKTNNLNSTTRILSQLQLRMDSNVLLINNNSTGFNLYEVYNTGFKRNGIFVVRDVGFWNSSLFTREQSRYNLKGAILNCVSVITEHLKNETYMHFLEASRHDRTDTLHKLKFYTVIRYLQEMYNFSVKVQRTNSWGYSYNGSFDGLIGALQRQEAEFGCSPVLFKINRAEVVDYVVPTWQTKHTFLFRQPKYQASYCSVYTRPLDVAVWRCMFGVLLIAGFTLYLILKIQSANIFLNGRDISLSLIWLFICSAVCQQGMPVYKNAVSARIIMFVTFMFSMMIYQFYNANVLSSLLNEQYNYIRSLNDLLQSDLKAGVEDMLFNKDYFKRTTDRVTLDLYKAKIATDNYYNFFDAEYGMALVKRGGFAFHVDTSAAYAVMRRTFSEREICEVGEVQLFPPQYVGAVAVKGSQYREYIAVGVSKLLETGLMNRIKLNWESRKPPCVKQRYSKIMAVNIREFSMALLFLVCGFIVSLFILVLEIFFKIIKRPPNVGTTYLTKRMKVNSVKRVHKRPLRKITFLN
ncbi:PREDICTED: glutamate receptor 1-like [Papilio polytes]|uniref:glutamate receptor 1-like n=1 Tax=Papilio polytes TaxID=76194 RepID=UPI000675CCD8|nr:PREDICTED: glutamate receptor 1-like [Papilio polytes]